MFDADRRPMGRLFYWLLAMAMIAGCGLTSNGAAAVPQNGPASTTVADTIYMADGNVAQGDLIITWPAFVTASGAAVAGGRMNVMLGSNGALDVDLVPNAGATPAGVYYTVVYQLGPGTAKTEYWVVPATSPASLAAVRTTPGSGVAGQPVSMQYVNSQLATKADDGAVMHLTGVETVSGAKTFVNPPNVPVPTSNGQVANKGYVDSSISSVGAGSFLSTAGGTMSGPITLPSNPSTMLDPATVLYDGMVPNAPGLCTYALVNAVNMHCGIAYTYLRHISLAEVRTALPDSSYTTRLVESMSDGGECLIASSTSLDFYPQYVPPRDTLIVVSYRGYGRAVAEVMNSTAVAKLQDGTDDGMRGIVTTLKTPSARTQADCEHAALAILDDAGGLAWMGTYDVWSDFLPGGADDIFPGDGLTVNLPSQKAMFSAIVRQISIDLVDPANDRGMYMVEFANDLAIPLALQQQSSATTVPLQDMPVRLLTSQVGTYYLTSLTNAQITQVSSTTVQIDAGTAPDPGFGIEVRAHDYSWGAANDRNLLGRFSTRTFNLPRLGRTQSYFLRLYDNSSPARYSRYAAALHLDYPL